MGPGFKQDDRKGTLEMTERRTKVNPDAASGEDGHSAEAQAGGTQAPGARTAGKKAAGRKTTGPRPPISRDLNDSVEILLELMGHMQAALRVDMELGELLALAETQGRTTMRLAALLKAQKALQPKDDHDSLMHRKIAEVLAEMRSEPWNPNFGKGVQK
jgi:hypothetical protein